MVYRAIGLMSGSSLDGLDIVFAELQENAGKWNYQVVEAACYPYSEEWIERLKNATALTALDYQLLHVDYGHYLGQQVNKFIEEKDLHYKVALIASHGHTSFHKPEKKMTAQLGDGAAIAAETRLPVVSDLRSLDLALGGQGAPIVPIGERLLLGDYSYFLNIGGIANISFSAAGKEMIAFDICAANRVLNMIANDAGKEYDSDGAMARKGKVNTDLLEKLDALDYYKQPWPKSLANELGTAVVYPLVKKQGITVDDELATYTEHIALQIKKSVAALRSVQEDPGSQQLLATGGGAFNLFLTERIKNQLQQVDVELVVPDEKLVNYKEALIMALIGVLRWREEYNVLSSVTGASRDSIGGALWLGQEA